MAGNQLHILILGDELGLGEPMKEIFQKEGHIVNHCTRTDDAFSVLSQGKVEFIFADCMLQGGMNGVDFVVHVRQNFPQVRAQFVLMSAVFTDKDFIKEALEKTRALAFLKKQAPFRYDQALQLLTKKEEPRQAESNARRQLYQMFAKEKVSTREKRKLIESLEKISGFDLPYIYSMLVETKTSGFLNIYEKSGAVSGISFSNGHIVAVDVEDKTTFLGEMLIQSGFAQPEHVRDALAARTNQKIGQRLIQSNHLSPHAFDLILTEQMNLRLSRTMGDHEVRVNFVATDVELTNPNIDSEQLRFYLHDWIASKIDLNWLKSLYLTWSAYRIQMTPTFKSDPPAFDTSLIRALDGLIPRIEEGTTLNQLLDHRAYPEAAVYKAIHFLLIRGLVTFGDRAGFKSEAEQQGALRKLWQEVQGRNVFEVVSLFGRENLEGERLLALLGPKPADPQSALATLWNNLKTKLEDAVLKSSDSHGRAQFEKQSSNKDAENKLKATHLLEQARFNLGLNQFAKAQEVLAEIFKINPHAEQIHLLLAWAKLGLLDSGSQKTTQLKEIELELVQVPAEEKYDAHYPFVMGLFQRARGDLMGAKKSLEKAIALNSGLIAARRELNAVETQLKKEKDIFSSLDVKGMVSGFFGKRK